MRWVVVQVHVTGVWVFSKDALIKLRNFTILFNILLVVTVILVHHFASQFHHFDIWVTHMQEDGRAHDHQPNIHSEQISRKDKEFARVIIELVLNLLLNLVDFL